MQLIITSKDDLAAGAYKKWINFIYRPKARPHVIFLSDEESPPSDFPNYASGTWGPETVQGLLAEGHSWPLPTELLEHSKKKGKSLFKNKSD